MFFDRTEHWDEEPWDEIRYREKGRWSLQSIQARKAMLAGVNRPAWKIYFTSWWINTKREAIIIGKRFTNFSLVGTLKSSKW